MIEQFLLLVFLFILGLAVTESCLCETGCNRLSPHLSLFAGTSVFALVFFYSLLVQGIFQWNVNISFFLAGGLCLSLILALSWCDRGLLRRLFKKHIPVTLLYFFLIAVVLLITAQFNFTVTTNDSYRYLELGEALAVRGFSVDERFISNRLLTARPVFYPMFHALSRPLGLDYLWAFPPVYGIAFIPAFIFLLKRILTSLGAANTWSRNLPWVMTVFLFSTPGVMWHLFLINSHMFTAIHFALFFMLGWLAISSRRPQLAYIALLILGSTALMRFENFVLLFVFGLLFASFWPDSRNVGRLISLSGLSVLIFAMPYYLILPAEGGRFVSSSTMMMAAAMGCITLMTGVLIEYWSLFSRLWSRMQPSLPFSALAMAALLTAFLFLFSFETAGVSVLPMMWNFIYPDYWGFLGWWLLAVLFFRLLLNQKVFPYELFFTAGIFLFIFLTVWLAFLRGSPYRYGGSDSANRMLIHIVPLITAYISIAAGKLAETVLDPNTPA